MLDGAVGVVFALFAASALLLSAHTLSYRLAGRAPILIRWTATIAALIWLQTAIFHVLAFCRLFSRPAAGAVVAGLALTMWHTGGGLTGIRKLLARDRVFVSHLARLFRRSPFRGRFWLLTMLALPGFVRLLLLPPMGWDSLTYHALKAGMWVQNGGVDSMNGPGPWAYYRNMLAGGEVFLAWPMLALHSDAMTWVADLFQYLGLGFCLIVLARRLGVREPLASTLAAFVLALPAVRLLVGSGYVEVGLLLALVSALVIGCTGGHAQGRLVPLASGALGVCAATKLPMVPICGLLLVVLTWRSIIRGPRSQERGHSSAWQRLLSRSVRGFFFVRANRPSALATPRYTRRYCPGKSYPGSGMVASAHGPRLHGPCW